MKRHMKNKKRAKFERMTGGVTLYNPTPEEFRDDTMRHVAWRLTQAMRGNEYYQNQRSVLLPLPGETMQAYDKRMYALPR